MPNETNTQTQPDFREAQRLLIGDRRLELKEAIQEELLLMSLYNSPSALKAMGLCKVEEVDERSYLDGANAAWTEARLRFSNIEAELNELKKATEANGVTYNEVKAALATAEDGLEMANYKIERVQAELKAVREMRNRLTESLSNCFALYGCDSIAELRLEVLQEAKAQKAKEAQL